MGVVAINKKTGIWIASAAILFVLFLILSFYFPVSQDNDAMILLPGGADDSIGMNIIPIGQNLKKIEKIEITIKNVQSVISSLERPKDYTFQAKSRLYYSTGSSLTNIAFACKGDLKRTEQASNNSEVKINLMVPPYIYVWSGDNNIVYKGVAADFTGDDMALMPTYETVVDCLPENIISAEILEINSNSCVVARTINSLTGYREVFYISVDNGILLKAETFDGDTLIYNYEITSFSLEAPDQSVFDIPRT